MVQNWLIALVVGREKSIMLKDSVTIVIRGNGNLKRLFVRIVGGSGSIILLACATHAAPG